MHKKQSKGAEVFWIGFSIDQSDECLLFLDEWIEELLFLFHVAIGHALNSFVERICCERLGPNRQISEVCCNFQVCTQSQIFARKRAGECKEDDTMTVTAVQ